MPATVYTIGHSNHGIEVFLELLRQHEITAVADVRSHPYSRFNPQFRKQDLQRSLEEAGLAYVFLGKELGARSEDDGCYVDNKVDYGLLACTTLFQSGIERVLRGANEHRIALMCAEKEPLDCHRTILVCRELCARDADVQHILADGSVELHDRCLDRLLALLGMPAQELFRSRDELLAEAYRRRGWEIAYER